jgi:hypothetical protein
MSRDALLWVAVGGLAVLIVVLLVLVVTIRRSLARAHTEIDQLRDRAVASPAASAPAPAVAPVEREYLITGLGSTIDQPAEPQVVDRALFADLVLRETVVKTASLAHGVRRALAPASRNRIRFEMRQEVRRSRKQRRADLKAAQRHLRAQQRAELAEEAS